MLSTAFIHLGCDSYGVISCYQSENEDRATLLTSLDLFLKAIDLS